MITTYNGMIKFYEDNEAYFDYDVSQDFELVNSIGDVSDIIESMRVMILLQAEDEI